MNDQDVRDFDVAVTFAGEERAFVEEVVRLIQADGFSVFYDEDAKAELWGEDLTEFFANVYEQRARFAVMFISAAYAAKSWTRLERRSVLARAMQEESPYLLPVRFDSTELPGVRGTIAYLDAHSEGASGIADAIRSKLRRPTAPGDRRFNGRVPRTDAELATLLGERPPGWEYLLLAYWLAAGIQEHQKAYNDHRMLFAVAGEYIPDDLTLERQSAEMARLVTTTRIFEDLLSPAAQELAVGTPGEAGDPELVRHLAERLTGIYAQLLEWSYRARSAALESDEGRTLFRVLARYVDQPIDAIRAFVAEFFSEVDKISDRIARGEKQSIVMSVKFEIPPELAAEHEAAMHAFGRMRNGNL